MILMNKIYTNLKGDFIMAKKVKKTVKNPVVEVDVVEEESTEEGAVEVDNTPRCRDCGKPLTDENSIAAGIGPECAQKDRAAINERKASITVTELPEGYITLKEAMDAAAKIGLPRNAAFTAAGRHAGASPVRNESWEPIFVKNRMHVPAAALEDLEEMLAEYQGAKEARKEARKAAKKAKKAKATEGDEDEFSFLSGSIASIRQHLAGSEYTSQQLGDILAAEQSGKNRAGAVKAITSARDERASLEAIEVKKPRKVTPKKVTPPVTIDDEPDEGALSVLDDLLG